MTTLSTPARASRPRWHRLQSALMCLMVLSACGGGGGGGGEAAAPGPGAGPGGQTPSPGPTQPLSDPRSSARIFFSGHSLTDEPLPEYVESIASSLNTQVSWNQQVVIGSPIRVRTRGDNLNATNFPGYSAGKNRNGTGMNVVNELRQPQTIGGYRYDTLVLAERHDVVATILWEGTVPYARHFHERLIEGNPQANTYLYHAWLGVPDKGNPANWITYERTAASAWQCVASRINRSLEHEGRSDRMVYLPAGLALAGLVEEATQGGGVPGVTGSSVRETVDRIFLDDVHVTSLGMYYIALVNYASVYRRSPVGAWAPAGVTATQAQSLQSVAWRVVSSHFNSFSPPTLEQCRVVMRDAVCPAYYNFVNRPNEISSCSSTFSGNTQSNPFYFNAATDGSYWYPAP